VKVVYGQSVAKRVKKKKLPREIWTDFRDAFDSLARTRNFRLFDIKKLVKKGDHVYYRLRIRKYRALFRIDEDTLFVEDIAPRAEVYRR
jgi:mRNA-degrading endonuclease RelE of RelBE toxin-antitoxin system